MSDIKSGKQKNPSPKTAYAPPKVQAQPKVVKPTTAAASRPNASKKRAWDNNEE